MSIDITIELSELRRTALFERTRPAPEGPDGTSWDFAAREDYGPDGFWNVWEVGTCQGDPGRICKFCHEWLYDEDGTWVDGTQGDTCSGDDEGNNENELHVMLESSDGHPTDTNGVCQLEPCPNYGDTASDVEGPMMNYWYPVGDSYGFYPEECAGKLKDLPLCVVQVSGDYGLALTGGGMDFTWEIVEAFVTLGYLPPLDHCDPPHTVDTRRLSDEQKYLLRTCRSSMTAGIEWLSNRLDYFDRTWRTE